MSRLILVPLLIALGLVACSKESTPAVKITNPLPENAVGDTPVKLVNCMADMTDCEVLSRYSTMNMCEEYREWASMVCDFTTNPKGMNCRVSKDSAVFTKCVD